MSHTHRPSIFRRFWKPAVVTGAGGTAIAVWFEEIMLYAEDILALIFLPIMAGVIYLLNIYIFNSRMPRREDHQNSKDTGAKE
jgi:hypothetical protein